jgi:hypothetical protein
MVAIAVLALMMVIVPGQATTTTAFDTGTVSNASVASHGIARTADGLLAAFASVRAATPEPVSLMVAGTALIAVGLALKRARKSA